MGAAGAARAADAHDAPPTADAADTLVPMRTAGTADTLVPPRTAGSRSAAKPTAPASMGAGAGAAPRAAAAWWRGASSRRRNTATGGVVLLVVLAIVGYALTLGSGAGPVTAARSRPTAAPSTPGPVSSSPAPKPSATPTQSTTPPATTAPLSVSTPSPAHAPPPPAPAVRLTAMLSMAEIVGFGRLGDLNFAVTNLGPATSAVVTVHVSVPPGMSMSFDVGQSPGWTCGAAGNGATCSHEPLTAGAGGSAILTVQLLSASACGRPIELSATSRFAHASASTPVRCGHHH